MILDFNSDGECSVTNQTVMFITAMMRKNSQWHPINGEQTGGERSSREGSPRLQWMFCEKWHSFHTYFLAMWLGENRWVQQTPKLISSLVIKPVTDKISSLLWHNSSGKLPPLHCPWNQNDSKGLPIFLPVELCFNLRFWCINWWWNYNHKHLNKQVTRKTYSAKIPIRCC